MNHQSCELSIKLWYVLEGMACGTLATVGLIVVVMAALAVPIVVLCLRVNRKAQ